MVSLRESFDSVRRTTTACNRQTWSFGICFGGNASHLECLIESIRGQVREDDEILVAVDENVTVPLLHEVRVVVVESGLNALAVKKHRLVAEARNAFICILHDYLELDKAWRDGFEALGSDWDVASSPTLDPARGHRRIADWMTLDHPVWGHGLIPYDIRSETDTMFLSGMYMCLRRDFLREHTFNFDPALPAGVPEDQAFARLVREHARWEFSACSRVYSQKRKAFPGTRQVRLVRLRLWASQRGTKFGRVINFVVDFFTLRNVLPHISSLAQRTKSR